MAGLNRRSAFAAVVLPLLVLATAGWARATVITVNTLDGGSDAAPLCTLVDAVTAANNQAVQNGCPAGSGNDTIVFAVVGTIPISQFLFFSSGGTLSIIGPAVSPGIAITGAGAGRIISVSSSSLRLKNLTLEDGSAVDGGAVLTVSTQLDIENCTFVGNIATPIVTPFFFTPGLGGAIFLEAGEATIVNSTFANNVAQPFVAPGAGGAIFNDESFLNITNSTFSGNNGGAGAALFPSGPTSLRGVILANSTGPDCGVTVTAITDDSFNIDDDGTCGLSAANNSKSGVDPLLDALANNGGPTQTFALETSPMTSPAIGLDKDCVDQATPTPNTITTDQRLFIRPNSPTMCDSGAYEHDGVQASIVEVPNTERLQIARSANPNSDDVNLALSFTEEKVGSVCVAGQDALNDGLVVQLYEGTCADKTSGPLFANLSPFVVHTVNHQSYGTVFQSTSPETVSARMVALEAPAGTCGEWSLNLEVAGLDTIAIGLGDGNPFALVLTDASGIATGCIDIDNAIVGSQIPSPTRKVRRRVRR